MSGPVVLSLGSINADFQLRVDGFHDFGQALRAGHDLVRLSGGKAANVAVLARRLGCEVQLLGRVGDDDLAEQALGPLRRERVDLRAVRRATGEATGFALLALGPDGDKRSVAAAGANDRFSAGDIDAIADAVRAAPAGSVLVADCEITPAAVSRAIAVARERGIPVVLDPSYPHQVVREDLRAVAVLTPNEREARALTGAQKDTPLTEVARALAALGPAAVCIKRKSGGCLVLHEQRLWHQPAEPAHAVDTSGAGDAFTGAIAVALGEGQRMEAAVRFAVAATELAVMAYGAQPSYPTRARLEEQLRRADRPLEPCAG